MGRFISEDPVGANLVYGYSSNNPINRIDPTGCIDYSSEINWDDDLDGYRESNYLPGDPSPTAPDSGGSDGSEDSGLDNGQKDDKKDEVKNENDKPNVEVVKSEKEKQLEMAKQRFEDQRDMLENQLRNTPYNSELYNKLAEEYIKTNNAIKVIDDILNQSSKGFDYNWTGKNVTSEFKSKVLEISNKLKIDPDDLMAIMAFESGFDPSIRNKTSGATGLIQFMSSTAKKLGTTTDKLAQMSAVQQLDYVYEYLKGYTGKMNNVQDAYMAVFMPIAVGKSNDFVIGIKGSTDKIGNVSYGSVYSQNSILDINKDGKITKEEAASLVEKTMNRYK